MWGMHGFNDYTLAFSILMIAFEIIAGVAVLLGWQMRLFSWLLLLLTIFFTFLTGYALFSGKIKECGCFQIRKTYNFYVLRDFKIQIGASFVTG